MEQLASFKDYTTICSSAPSEVLALMALRSREQVFQRNLEIIRVNLDVLDSVLCPPRGDLPLGTSQSRDDCLPGIPRFAGRGRFLRRSGRTPGRYAGARQRV